MPAVKPLDVGRALLPVFQARRARVPILRLNAAPNDHKNTFSQIRNDCPTETIFLLLIFLSLIFVSPIRLAVADRRVLHSDKRADNRRGSFDPTIAKNPAIAEPVPAMESVPRL